MLDTLMSTMAPSFARYLATGKIPARWARFSMPSFHTELHVRGPRNHYCGGQRQALESFCEALGRPDLTNHPDYKTNPLRVKNRAVLEPILEGIFRSQPRTLDGGTGANRVPCTLVRNLKEVIDDEQTAARNMTPVVEHAEAGPVRVLGVPVVLSETPGRIASAAPLLGADTKAVLNDLPGVTDRLRNEFMVQVSLDRF